MSVQALSGIKVLDVGDNISAPYCTKLFADFGAEVIKVENPDGGDSSRKSGPFPDNKPHGERSGLFAYLNNNKLSITLNLRTDTGVNIFKELIKKVDVLVENFNPSFMPGLRLAYDDLKMVNPGVVMTSISNFGDSGPYRDFKATDIVLQAISGWAFNRGEPDREPVSVGGGLGIVEFIGGTYAASGTMTALMHKIATGKGQHVEVSLVEAAAAMLSYPVATDKFPGNPGWRKFRYVYTPGVEECKDGYVGINTLTGMQWKDLCAMMGMDDWAENPAYNTMVARFARRQEVRDRLHEWLKVRTREQILREGIDWRVPVAMVNDTEQLLNSPQYQARDYFVEVEHPVLGKVTQPGAPFRMAATPWQIKSPAPTLGEHNTDIYGRLLGYEKDDLVRLRQAGVI